MDFIDTNIFIYAHDTSDAEKTRIARTLLLEVSTSKKGRISTQVVQEFCNVVLKKSIRPLEPADVRKILHELMLPLLAHHPDAPFYGRVLETYERYSLGFYDAMIVQAAIDLDCTILYSEDLQTNTKFGKVKVINPFI